MPSEHEQHGGPRDRHAAGDESAERDARERLGVSGSPDTTPGAEVSTNKAKSSSTTSRSSNRSRMIVAKAAVALSPSRRASR
jgi:hypothetical protein